LKEKTGSTVECAIELARGRSSILNLKVESDGSLSAVKTASTTRAATLIDQDRAILEKLNHPLVMKCRSFVNGNGVIAMEFIPNGSLADHLPSFHAPDSGRMQYPTRTAKIICGIALAMRYFHSRGVIHQNLTPENILLDWNWNIRIANLGRSHSGAGHSTEAVPAGDPHYLAPECLENVIAPANDVFSFGLILYEIITGRPVFSKSLTACQVTGILMKKEWELDFPSTVNPDTEDLIRYCLEGDRQSRPPFDWVFDRLEEMEFRVADGVNSGKVALFVGKIKAMEAANQLGR
jgi:serine/threonine protein kinase